VISEPRSSRGDFGFLLSGGTRRKISNWKSAIGNDLDALGTAALLLHALRHDGGSQPAAKVFG
jgi:hypothetical protein